jgi:hypothetical protein
VFQARVTGTASGGDVWRGTQYRFGDNNRQCVTTSNGSGTVTFNLTARGFRNGR